MQVARNFKRFPNNDYTRKLTSQFDSSSRAPITTHYEAVGGQARTRKVVVFAVVIAFLASVIFAIWNAFIRYEAYGVVDANILRLSSPIEGEIKSMLVQYGQQVRKGQVLFAVANAADSRQLEKIGDEIAVIQAEISAKRSQLLWETASNREAHFKAESELETAQGDLAELRSQRELSVRTLERFTRLKMTDAVSEFELDKARVSHAALQDQIDAKERAVDALKKRLPRSRLSIDDEGQMQVLPLQQKLGYLQNEKTRLEERMREGEVVSPVDGVVSQIHGLAGERTEGEPVVDVVEDGTTKFVLYYPADSKLPKANERMDVWVSSKGEYVTARVRGNSKDTFAAPTPIRRKYQEDEQLVRVFLEVADDPRDLVVGGVIMKPYSLRRVASRALPALVVANAEH